MKKLFGLFPKPLKFIKTTKLSLITEQVRMDYALGIAEMAQAILENREPLLNTDFCLHVNELTLKIQNSKQTGCFVPETTFSHKELLLRNRLAQKLVS
ncbi:MAG: hypothetical protein ACK4K9_03460 [Bacteroidia bacterium]